MCKYMWSALEVFIILTGRGCKKTSDRGATMLGLNDNCDILVWDLWEWRRLYYRQSHWSSPSPIQLTDSPR